MHFFVRCLLWMLMAALPLQGSAKVFAACAASVSASPSAAASAAAAHGCHERDAAAAAAAALQQQADDGEQPRPHGKCSTCASCCTAATAPPQSALPPAPFPRAARTLPAAEPAFTAIVPAGLERPPRAV